MKNRYKLPFSFLFLFTVLFVQAQTADEILTNHINALGGKEKLTSLKSVKRVFKTDNELAGGGSVILVEGQGARIESESLFGTSLTVANKKKGWTIVKTPLDDKAEVKEMDETDHSLLFPDMYTDIEEVLPWKIIASYIRYGPSKYTTVTLMGKENVSGKECFKIKIKYIDSETWYIDSNTWLLVQMQKGSGDEATTVRYSEYRKDANGILLAYKEEMLGKDGKVLVTTTTSEFETNIKVDKSIFTYKP
ncbi:MAG TPA: hypothetical protein VHM26_17515 [Chitinophagaceae bacterium]|nr:hypothetical protein [Chitinophagaceae bacterium]